MHQFITWHNYTVDFVWLKSNMADIDSEMKLKRLNAKNNTDQLFNLDQRKENSGDEDDSLVTDKSDTSFVIDDDLESNQIRHRLVRRASSVSKSGLRPFFLANLSAPKIQEDSSFSNITLTNPTDKIEKTEAFKKVINFFHENHEGWETPTVTFTNTSLPKELKKYINIIQDANIDFTIDLPLHLYNAHLLSTRNKNIPGFEFTAWPLPSNDLITPRDYLFDTNFSTIGDEAKAFNEIMYSQRFAKVDYVVNQKRIAPKSSMTCFWHPKIDASAEMDECIDAIFEQNINRRISKHFHKKKHNLTDCASIQRKDPVDLTLDAVLKRKLYGKLNNLVDRMVDTYMNAERNLSSFPKMKGYEIPVRGMDWLDVASQLEDDDRKSQALLFKLFRHQLKKDTINGPVDRYPHEYESYNRAEEHRHKILKRLIKKHPKKHKDEKRMLYQIKNDFGSFLHLNGNKKL